MVSNKISPGYSGFHLVFKSIFMLSALYLKPLFKSSWLVHSRRQSIWDMKKYEEVWRKYEGNMKKYEERMRSYGEKMKKYGENMKRI